MISLTQQVGGTHYKQMGMQPFEFSLRNGWDAAAHSVLKYVARHKSKGGKQDLEKAMHICDIRADLLPLNVGPLEIHALYLGKTCIPIDPNVTTIERVPMVMFCGANNILHRMPEFAALMELERWVVGGHMDTSTHKVFATLVKQKIADIIVSHNY